MTIKRVLLINPPDTRPPDMLTDKVRIGLVPPLGLASIAAVLEQRNIEVRILDCVGTEPSAYPNGDTRYGLTDGQIAAEIASYQPDMVGVSCLFSNKAFDAHNVCRIAKGVNPAIVTVMGGAHPSANPYHEWQDKNLDYVVIGEGEYNTLDMIRCFNAGVKVVSFDRYQPANLDADIPLPARHLLPMDRYLSGQSPHSGQKRTPATTISTSRGCPQHCAFCAIKTMWGDSYRTRSAENVLAEIEHLIDKYGIKELQIEDDSFTANKRRAMAILQGIIDRRLDLAISSPSGLAVRAMDEQLIDKMAEAGYYSISLAIESGVPEVLKLMKKTVDLTKAQRLIKYARSVGIKTKTFWILGYPGDSIDGMKRTMQVAYDMGADWTLWFPATPLPGTPMLETCQDNGWLVDPHLDYRYQFYKPNIRTPEFTPDDVMELRDKANRELNFERNVNVREGRYQDAIEDFEEITRLYPDLEIARRALKDAKAHVAH